MLNNTTANVICRIVFGRRFEYDDEELQGILRGFFENFSTISGIYRRRICRVVLDFFAAGTETTSTALSWAILYLCLYPDVQTKVQSELDTVVGRGRQPAISDRARLPYCEATLMESMRIRPVLPLSLPHTTSRSVSLGGFTIPQGNDHHPNIWAAHHDPEVWDDPDDFRPERFLENHDSPTVKKNDSWIPFGLGRRECLGAQLAKMESFLLFRDLNSNSS
ncbi:cytochrome P450 2U1-like [Strongylocentrotus purpuratus]|uniref:Cytochrome P450 n=1 Tax=Strongylocentrotus purpuratus TaxID=7668 RepID=A0A7M7NNU4_STRPU|nr:cytochrome P450 2U1-like [Strongylocentrotus purpuratus]